ncbi:MAG: M20/M25/M40 family metallo-hydrolase [Acidovorax sp.]|jgi:acetylornithine deacetylase/succinyl-diaminopimelate desuccinylase-like protein|nr:M20/M25/M40 family metallo-hydrolase [Acidovorax sp.]
MVFHFRALAAAVCVLFATGAQAQVGASTPEQKRFYAIYKELVEINTTHSVGSNTEAAQAMHKRLLEDGIPAAHMQIFEPFPKKGNLVVRFKGSGQGKPLLLMAHLDVVEARREDWKSDPFKLKEDDGYFTARGASDDKAMAAAFVSILGQLKREGFVPSRDIVLTLTADEERLDVPSNGVSWLLKHQPQLLDVELGINEGGGGLLENGKPVLYSIQVAEKMYADYQLESTDKGGHSSMPTAHNPVYALSASLSALSNYHFPVKLSEVTQAYFARSAGFAKGQQFQDMQAVAGGQPSPEALQRLSASPMYNASLRTTCVATEVNAGHAPNALPQRARATINCRILPHDDPAAIEAQLRKLTENEQVKLTVINPPLRSPASPMRADVMQAVQKLTETMWPGVPVIPVMSAGATDSRFLRNIGVPMYGISGIFFDPSDARAHGLDERVAIPRLYEGREFLYALVKTLSK